MYPVDKLPAFVSRPLYPQIRQGTRSSRRRTDLTFRALSPVRDLWALRPLRSLSCPWRWYLWRCAVVAFTAFSARPLRGVGTCDASRTLLLLETPLSRVDDWLSVDARGHVSAASTACTLWPFNKFRGTFLSLNSASKRQTLPVSRTSHFYSA